MNQSFPNVNVLQPTKVVSKSSLPHEKTLNTLPHRALAPMISGSFWSLNIYWTGRLYKGTVLHASPNIILEATSFSRAATST